MIRCRTKPRRGKIMDRDYLDWLHSQDSIVPTHDPKCRGCPVTAHHVRRYGEPKQDRRAVPLYLCRHVIVFGDATVEHGKEDFQNHFGVDLEQEIVKHNQRYLEAA